MGIGSKIKHAVKSVFKGVQKVAQTVRGVVKGVVKGTHKLIKGIAKGNIKGAVRGFAAGFSEGLFEGLSSFLSEKHAGALAYGLTLVGFALASVAASFLAPTAIGVLVAGVSYLLSDSITQGAMEQYVKNIFGDALEQLKSQRHASFGGFLGAVYTGEIYDWLAGGDLRNACYAGGVLFNWEGLIDPMAKATGYPQELSYLGLEMQTPYNKQAGGDAFMTYLAGGKSFDSQEIARAF